MSVICQNFVQNAWRKDLCSNCFKSLADHTDTGPKSPTDRGANSRYIPQATSLYQSRVIPNIHWRTLLPEPPLRLQDSICDRVSCRDFGSQTNHVDTQMLKLSICNGNEKTGKGILKDKTPPKKPHRTSVGFISEEPLVIGYGGRDYDSDESPWEMGSDDGSINLELLDLTEEDRTITKLTKNNTEFNSVNENLIASPTLRENSSQTPASMNNTNKNGTKSQTKRDINSAGQDNKIQVSKLNNQMEKELKYFSLDKKEDTSSPKSVDQGYVENYSSTDEVFSHFQDEKKTFVEKLNKANILKLDESVMKTLHNDDVKYFDSTNYALISKLNNEVSSDSDYSTSRQTNGESSTDSESFHDSEDTIIVPCSSFLHGAVNQRLYLSQNNDKVISQPFEFSSVSSGDTSTLSDDSDSQKSSDQSSDKNKSYCKKIQVVNNKHANIRTSLLQPNIMNENSSSNIQPFNSASNSAENSSIIIISKSQQKPDKMENRVAEKISEENFKPEKLSDGHSAIKKEKIKCNMSVVTQNQSHSISPTINKCNIIPSSTEFFPKQEDNFSQNRRNTFQNIKKGDSEDKETNVNTFKECNKDNEYKKQQVKEKLKETEKKDTSERSEKNKVTGDKEYENFCADNEEYESRQSMRDSSPSTNNDGDELSLQDKSPTDSNRSSNRSSPDSKQNRMSKLAALAQELEKARREAATATPNSEIKKTPSAEITSNSKVEKNRGFYSFESTPTSHISSEANTKIQRGRSISMVAPKTLPDLLPETASKLKKGRFSLKKLLKRNKDSECVTPSNSENNPKAWKRQTFDRSRLSLEIVHPMDLTSDSQTSTETTPTDEIKKCSIFTNPSGRMKYSWGKKAGAARARSLSALPLLTSCTYETGDLKSDGHQDDITLSLDRSKLDRENRKAGTVAERSKKYKAPRRTPSFSELHTATSGRSTVAGAFPQRPPKPPPPPRGKSLSPPAPPLPPQKPNRASLPAPARPPPPKVLGCKETALTNTTEEMQEKLCGDYANLGDIRLHIAPKKPQRPSSVSFARDTLEMEVNKTEERINTSHEDNTYETLEAAEEEDHYTYLDESEKKTACKKYETKKNTIKNSKMEAETDQVLKSTNQCSTGGRKPPQRPANNKPPAFVPRTSITMKKPWLDLQASYAAIAAANYESLAELITTALNEGAENFQKLTSSLQWSDFDLESEEPCHVLDDKAVFNALYKKSSQTQVSLVLTEKQHTSQSCRNAIRPPVLASFTTILSNKYKRFTTEEKNCSQVDKVKFVVYVLQRSKTSTIDQFASTISCFQTNQHIHLRNACFLLLQLIHTLKNLQAEGVEEIDYNLSQILLLNTDADKPPILILLPEDKIRLIMTDFYKSDTLNRKSTLCQATLQLLFYLLHVNDVTELETCIVNGEPLAAPVAHTFKAIAKILSEEKASSLTQAKGLLEYMLWGPVDVECTPGFNIDNLDVILQRWLDLQRAQMVKTLVSNLHLKISSHAGLHVYEEYQLIFLLQANVKSLKDIICKL